MGDMEADIRTHQIQKEKCFPLPTYDLSNPNRVKVCLYEKILDKNYTQLLHANADLDLATVFLLDKVQKKEIISKESYLHLKKQGLVEGRYPHIFVSYKVANIVGQQTDYIRNKGLSSTVFFVRRVDCFSRKSFSNPKVHYFNRHLHR